MAPEAEAEEAAVVPPVVPGVEGGDGGGGGGNGNGGGGGGVLEAGVVGNITNSDGVRIRLSTDCEMVRC